MLIANLGVLGVFENKMSRYCEWSPNHLEKFLAYYQTGTIPSFTFITSFGTYNGTPIYKADLYDGNDNLITNDIATIQYLVSQDGTYVQIVHNDELLSNYDDGFYYLKITTSYNSNIVESFYTDVFRWEDTVTDFVKVSVTDMADVKVGKLTKYKFDLTTYTIGFTFYIDAEYEGINSTQKELANDDFGIMNIAFGSTSIERSFIACCNESMLVFLRQLRTISGNGTVVITFQYKDYYAMDITSEISSNETGAFYLIKLAFKTEAETISMCNDII